MNFIEESGQYYPFVLQCFFYVFYIFLPKPEDEQFFINPPALGQE
jgi:hypothetical protein